MLKLALPIICSVAAGGCVVLQQVLNAKLRVALDSAAWSSFANFLVGLMATVAVAMAMRAPLPALSLATSAPWWAWGGGLFGAIFIAFAVTLVPQTGAATFMALMIAGQMLVSALFDQFGWLGMEQRPLDMTRLLGIALVIGGVALMQR